MLVAAAPMIEIRHLQSLIALAEAGSVSRAARLVHLSQPAFSHQMKAIEDSLGATLFERKTRPLRLTPAGERVLQAAYDATNILTECERDVNRIAEGRAGQLRIAVECHSCFDWLMPSMDRFREQWPEVDMDLVSGFHADPTGLLLEDRADLVIVSKAPARKGVVHHPLFRYEVLALMARDHALTARDHLTATDFARETLITYPIPDDRIDVLREVLNPARINPERRTTTLTVAILQLVASRRGIAAMPGWAVQPYLERGYVAARPIRRGGLTTTLYAATTHSLSRAAYMRAFRETMHETCFAELEGIQPVKKGK